MRFNSIRVRLTLTATLATFLLMLIVCTGVLLQRYYQAEHSASKALRTLGDQVRTDIASIGGNKYDFAETVSENKSLLQEDHIALVMLDSKGNILEKSQEMVPQTVNPPASLWRVTTIPAGKNTIVLGIAWGQNAASFRQEALVFLALASLVTLASAIGSHWLIGRTLLPITRLSEQAQSASDTQGNSLQLRLSASSHDAEIVYLVGTLNRLLERIEQTSVEKSRFYASASHELRTPLQVLSGSLEVALSRERSWEEYLVVVQEAYSQTRQLRLLVQDLLRLNQLDFVSVAPPSEQFPILETIEKIVENYQVIIEQKNLTIVYKNAEITKETCFILPKIHCEIILRNLLENAINYSPKFSESSKNNPINIVINSYSIAIENTYLSIENSEKPEKINFNQWFEPFYRPDLSRNIETGGNGLGLAICKAIAKVNHWEIVLEQSERENCIRATCLFHQHQNTNKPLKT